MTQDQAKKIAEDNNHLVGQRWKNMTSGEIETVIDVKPIELRKVNHGWAVTVVFIPVAENINVKTREHFLDTFYNNYIKLN